MLAPGEGGVGTASGGTRFDLDRIGGFAEEFKSMADAVRASCEASGGPLTPDPPIGLLAWLGEAVWAREGGGGGADG